MQLRHLDLENVNILPKELGLLVELEALSLSHVKWHGPLLQHVEFVTSLTSLVVNNGESATEELDVLTDLHHFRALPMLSSLQLGGPGLLFPRAFSVPPCQLRNVSSLHLERCAFEAVPQSLLALPSLTSLVLRHGPLSGLPDSIPSNRIRCLDFSCNEFTEVPAGLASMPALETLSLISNPLCLSQSFDFLAGLPSVCSIRFGYELVTSVHRDLAGLRCMSPIAGFNLGTLWMAMREKVPKCSLYI
ncbi:unnamed protein product [Ostreobium quekettii]|uniref:Uncharacterized protein n=1 Tax=Ostreobium quekettii TaxID=121088 RepID=A0A8S1JC02_9CHLO|nr:unnamed protein product [Ostreobium quekettii]